jgi:hypothetical protein
VCGGFGADRACAFEQWWCAVVAEVHDQGGRAALGAAVHAATLGGEGGECIGGVLAPFEHGCAALRVGGAQGLGDVPDRLFEGGALFEWECAAEAEFALVAAPGHAQRPPLVERGVIRNLRWREYERGACDLAWCFADGDPCELGVGLGRRELGGGGDLVECQLAGAERRIERR